jgi:hypothetical protein
MRSRPCFGRERRSDWDTWALPEGRHQRQHPRQKRNGDREVNPLPMGCRLQAQDVERADQSDNED